MTALESDSLQGEERLQTSEVFPLSSPQDYTPSLQVYIPYPFLLSICNMLVAVTILSTEHAPSQLFGLAALVVSYSLLGLFASLNPLLFFLFYSTLYSSISNSLL